MTKTLPRPMRDGVAILAACLHVVQGVLQRTQAHIHGLETVCHIQGFEIQVLFRFGVSDSERLGPLG